MPRFGLAIRDEVESLLIGDRQITLPPLWLTGEFTRMWSAVERAKEGTRRDAVGSYLRNLPFSTLDLWLREASSERDLLDLLGRPYPSSSSPRDEHALTQDEASALFLETWYLLLAVTFWVPPTWPAKSSIIPAAEIESCMRTLRETAEQQGRDDVDLAGIPQFIASFAAQEQRFLEEQARRAGLPRNSTPKDSPYQARPWGMSGGFWLKGYQQLLETFRQRVKQVVFEPNLEMGLPGRPVVSYTWRADSLLPLAWMELLWGVEYRVKAKLCVVCGRTFALGKQPSKLTCSKECMQDWAIERRGGPEAYRAYVREKVRACRAGKTKRRGFGAKK